MISPIYVAAVAVLVSQHFHLISGQHGLELTVLKLNCPSKCLCDMEKGSVACELINDISESMLRNFQEYFSTYPVRSFSIHTSSAISPMLKLSVDGVRSLNISNNQIQVIPSKLFSSFIHIQVLDISYNDIDTIEESAFSPARDHIHALNISYNKLSAIPSKTFVNLVNLQTLDLSNNRLERITTDIFDPLSKLQTLDLSFNKLTYVSSKHFAKLTNLNKLLLHNNLFHTFHSSIIPSLSRIPVVDISFNPFDCSCSVSSLIAMVKNDQNVVNSDDTTCSSTEALKGRRLADVEVDYLNCSHPRISYISPQQKLMQQTDLYLSCKVAGYPDPSVIWGTPWGEYFSHHTYHPLIGDDATDYQIKNAYIGQKMFITSQVKALSNGSLHITNFRGFFAGNFTCLALTPIGNVSATVIVDIYAPIAAVYVTSLIIGSMSAACFLVLGIIIAIILTLVRRVCCRDRFMEEVKKEKIPDIVITIASDDDTTVCSKSDTEDSHDEDDDNDEFAPESPLTSIRSENFSDSDNKYHSPTSESPPQGWLASNMIETLDEVRTKFRYGMERKIETVRCHAKAIKDSSGKKIDNVRKNVKTMKDTSEKKIDSIRTNVKSMKDSGTVYMQSIKDTTGHAANKVRAGVVLSVETVKYTVQSMKELCGTGEMGGQTISMMSVETDIDSNQSKEIVRSVTFV